MSKHFIYVADPMCSWCWGFSPVINKVDDSFGEDAPIRVMVGGLRAGNTEAMRDKDKDYIRNHWAHVQEASGQPFDFSFFDQEGFVYDTEPACRAIVTARKLDETKVLPFLEVVQRAFYAEGKDTTDENVLADLAGDFGFDRDAFYEVLTADETKEETLGDFWFSQKSGVTGFPTLIAVEDEKGAIVTAGFQEYESLETPLGQWVSGQMTLAGEAAS